MVSILVVDDDPVIRQLLTYQLGGSGYHVCTAQSGWEALERLPLEHPDLVLLDVVMPGLSGWEVCRQIRASSSVPIIMLTAKSAETDMVAGLGLGADDYIAKPFGLPHLLARVESVLRRARPAQKERVDDWSAPGSNGKIYSIHTQHTQALTSGTERNAPTTMRTSHKPYQTQRTNGRTGRTYTNVAASSHKAPTDLVQALSSRSMVGRTLAEARAMLGLSLQDVERACGIRADIVQALEREQFSSIPHAQLHHILNIYSSFLGLDLNTLVTKPHALYPLYTPQVPPPEWVIQLIMLTIIVLVIAAIVLFQLS